MRLKQVMAERSAAGTLPENFGIMQVSARLGQEPIKSERFFTEGTDELKAARIFITKFSLPRARARLEAEQQKYKTEKSKTRATRDEERRELSKQLQKFTLQGSQVGGERPVQCCVVSPSNDSVLTGSWDMGLRLWTLPQLAHVATFRGHSDRVTTAAWQPCAGLEVSFVSGSADAAVCLWQSSSSNPVRILEGHQDRVCGVAFHPSGRYVGSTSFDETWRLWDVDSGVCLLTQPGHAREVYAIDFQPDGSLCCTTDLSGIVRVWDMRTGRGAMVLQGHFKEVLSCSFATNGHQLATGSSDNTCKLWDLRKKDILYTIAAHANIVDRVKFEPSSGSFIATSSHDETCKLWDTKTFQIITVLPHPSKVMCCDVSSDGESIVTACFDRTFHLWKKGLPISINRLVVPESELLKARQVAADAAMRSGVGDAAAKRVKVPNGTANAGEGAEDMEEDFEDVVDDDEDEDEDNKMDEK